MALTMLQHERPSPDARYPDELPKGYYWTKVMEWTCSIHFAPPEDCECSYDEQCCACGGFKWDWPVLGCTCDSGAKWRWTGEWEITCDLLGINAILRDFYLPVIREQLNADSFLLTYAQEDAHDRGLTATVPIRASDVAVPAGLDHRGREERAHGAAALAEAGWRALREAGATVAGGVRRTLEQAIPRRRGR